MSIPELPPPGRVVRGWLWAPITVFRTALVAIYLLSIYSGIVAGIASIPLFELLDLHPGYTIAWAITFGTAAAVAAVAASFDDDDRRAWLRCVEKWAGIVWVSTFGLYVLGLNYVAYHENDATRAFGSTVALMAWVLPASRSAWLAAQAGKQRG